MAIMVPCWKEHEVIFSMLSSNSRLLRYEQAHYFVGVYLNDPLTQDEVRKAQALYKNIHMVLVPHDGADQQGGLPQSDAVGNLPVRSRAKATVRRDRDARFGRPDFIRSN
jgi:hypothetical protein